MRKLILLLTIIPLHLFSSESDSLALKFETATTDDKIKMVFAYLPSLERENADSSYHYIKRLQEIGISEKRDDVLAFSQYYFGTYLLNKGARDEAEKKLIDAQDYFLAVENDSVLAELINIIGTMHFMSGDVLRAEEAFLKSMQHGKKSSIKKFQMFSLMNLARVYMRQDKNEKAKELLDEYIDYYKSQNNYINVSSGYGLLGQLAMADNNLDLAIDYYERSLELSLSAGNPGVVGNGYTNKAIACFFKEDYDRAEQYFRLALSYRKLADRTFYILESYHNLGDFFQGIGVYDSSLVNYYKVIELAEETGDKLAAADAYKEIANVYEFLTDYEKQADALKKFIALNQEILGEKNTNELALLRMSFEAERSQILYKADQREDQLKTKVASVEKIWQYWIIVITILILLSIGFYFFRRNKLRVSN